MTRIKLAIVNTSISLSWLYLPSYNMISGKSYEHSSTLKSAIFNKNAEAATVTSSPSSTTMKAASHGASWYSLASVCDSYKL
ncbi:MAG: hypothetical protein M3270_03795 [Thermoproteota archaeon]|nr:hypothetical protein [Thermoproteota archaeon]